MNDKIKELREKRAAANFEKYVALFAKQNATADYREKLGNNHEYAQAQQEVNKLGEQLDKLITQKNKLNDRIYIARLKAQRIREKIETQFEYKTACNYRDETRNKCWEAQDYLHQLIAKEAENDARQH